MGWNAVATASVTVAVPVLVLSAWLVAVTVTVCWVVMLAGAVYRPVLLMLPTFGPIDQVTAVLALPVTVAVNCWVCPAFSVAVAGATETETVTVGVRVTVAVADLVLSAWLVAGTVTRWGEGRGGGGG